MDCVAIPQKEYIKLIKELEELKQYKTEIEKKEIVYKNMTRQFKFPHFNITINNFMLNIGEIEKIDYDDNFIVILN